MGKKILDVGQCDIDNWNITQMLTNYFDVEVDRIMAHDDAMNAITLGEYDLVLINRINDADGSEGMELIRRIKQTHETENVDVMVVSNFPESQDEAVAVGALRGFGKASLNQPATIELLKSVLG
ncbi:MAG: hypothetical protein AAFN77_04030 [Planctomycetota bacterium]